MGLVIQQGTIGDAPALRLAGRVIESDSKKMAAKLETLCRKKAKRIVVDVGQVELMDSRGLGSLMYYFTLLKRQGRQLIILNTNTSPTAYMYQLFQQTHLDQVLTVYTDPAQLH